ncbi:MAG: Zinc-specific metallo-regulatory protein [Firmicutes bacterium ADurb.Bin248]|nr:MAG: Zinc-specific metallo-regulatory protein [Firmicutes bacterium ADurb.Bin248]HOG01144.1 transcriptional repressor [Clostridia bacterium]HPK16500.1 transcriptional repressor [Clostridia bacterium]
MKEKLDAGSALAQSGLRNTRPRAAVLSLLEASAAPLSAEQVYLALREKGVAANLSTVYRAIEALCEKGLAAKLSIPGDPRAFFEFSRAAHRHYLICLGCREIRSLERCPLAGYEKALEQETDYRISGHKLVVYGYCPACRGGVSPAAREGAP